jgi:antitoxin component of MazEF toxin-antitoxin module
MGNHVTTFIDSSEWERFMMLGPQYGLVYTMDIHSHLARSYVDIVKIRRVGNSNVVSLPRSLEAFGYVPGIQVVVEMQPDGAILLRPVETARAQIRAAARLVITEKRGALDILTKYDRGEPTALQPPDVGS